MARKGNPISVRLDLNRSSDSSWFSDYYYGKLVYQDLNLRSYFDKIHPPTRLTFGFRVGRSIILHFPKRTCIYCFIPRLPRVLKKRRAKSRERRKAKKDWLWKFGKVDPIRCLHSRDGTEEDRKEMIGLGSGKRVESIKLDDWEKQNQRRSWTTKKEGYRYHDRSKKNLSKLLQVSGAFKQSTYAEVVNGIAFQSISIGQKKKEKKRRKKSRSDSLMRLKRNLPAVRSSLNYLVMQYLLNQKNKMHFDPVLVLNHFVAPGVSESSTMGGANAQERSLDKRIRSRIAFFLESLTSENKKEEGKKNFTHFIRQVNDLRFAGRTKTSISLFPFFGATFFFLRDGLKVKIKMLFENACNTREIREKCLDLFKKKCWKKQMEKDKVKNLIDLGGKGELIKGIEMMIEIILRNRRIPYGSNCALNEVRKMRSLLSNRTKTNTLMELVKIKSLYQSASLIAQDISLQLRTKKRSFRSIFSQIVKKIPKGMKKRVTGIRISCSGRLDGGEIARTECGKYGKTSCNVFNQKIDYASTEVATRYGILGVKVWISYSQKRKEHAI